MNVLRTVVCWLMLITVLIAGDAQDQWYVGELGIGALKPQPAISLHLVSAPVTGGGRSTVSTLAVVLRRPFGAQESRIEVHQRQELAEDSQGRIVSFRIDHDENGERTMAVGRIEAGKAVAEVHRLGRIERQVLVIPEGGELLGQIASQERMAQAVAQSTGVAPPQPVKFLGVELISNSLTLVHSTATYQKTDPGGNFVFSVATSILPIPSRIVVNQRGELVAMGLDLGPFKLDINRAAGPVALLGATVDAARLVALKGPPPEGREVERYRLPDGATVPVGDAQTQEGDVVTVRRLAPLEPLPDPQPFLAREAQLELDDPALRAWVAGIVAGHVDQTDMSESLRLAVRSHITSRDLATADGSALATFRNRAGDCSEHANLLCAVLRIAGIPARVDVGLIFSMEHGAWVGHAWVNAWIEGRWRVLDAAYPGVQRSRYLRLGTSSGMEGTGTQGAIIAALATIMGRSIECLQPE